MHLMDAAAKVTENHLQVSHWHPQQGHIPYSLLCVLKAVCKYTLLRHFLWECVGEEQH